MPMITTDDDPSLWDSVLTPTRVTDAAWRPLRVSSIQSANASATPSSAGQGRKIQAARNATSTSTRPVPRRKDLSFFMACS